MKILYELGYTPKVWVLNPALSKRKGVNIPHMYGQSTLCLFLPKDGSWRSNKLIASTIIPWASEWLYFYEMWHVTGKWLGGGVHPTVPKRDNFKDI